MKIGLVQYDPVWEDKEKNKEKIKNLLISNFKHPDVLIFPEMSLTGFSMKSKQLSESLEDESFKFFSGIAFQNKVHVFAGIIEKEREFFFNSLIHIDDSGKLINKYRKIHPFSYSTEDKNYSRGNNTVVTKIGEWKIGLSICYDLRFPELYRHYGKDRTDLIINIANWPVDRIEHWHTLLKARAIENQCYIAGVNRVGDDPKLNYNGFSSVFDPIGEELTNVEKLEKIITIDISRHRVEEVRTKFPFLNDIHLI